MMIQSPNSIRTFAAPRGILLFLFATTILGAAAARKIEPVQGALGFTDRQFRRNAAANEERAAKLVSESDFDGLLLDAPRRARLGGQDNLPLIGVRASSIRDNRMVSLQRRAIVVVVRPEDDDVFAATVFHINEGIQRQPAPKDEESMPKGRTVKSFQFLLNERIDNLPREAGTLYATLLLFDRRSNTVAIQLEGRKQAGGAKREIRLRRGYPPGIHPPLGPATAGHPYRPRPDSPPPPGAAAIALATDPASAGVVRGSFELPVREADVVRPLPGPAGSNAESAARAAGWVEVGDPEAVAVLTITLLLTGDQDAHPILVPLRVPVYGRLERKPEGVEAKGYFSLDLLKLLGGELRSQRYAVWAFSRFAISAPACIDATQPKLQPSGRP